ncbi:hypothetical protein AVEN_23782-1 [Araneus ventricosus]|uniref:Protein quiver n=1 Tax=Araneus ventricosus TaxID=182803 RepID=A0A4Y2DE20_ARAVE|nr:hypothetical protein AVEN_23782-1 [Araneus ventricosus]
MPKPVVSVKHRRELERKVGYPPLHLNCRVINAEMRLTEILEGEIRIIRSCGYYDPESAGTCVSRAGTHLVFMHYCQCAGDGCNKSSPLIAPPALLLAFILTLVFLAPKLRVGS